MQVTSLMWLSQTTLFSVQRYRVINKVINFKKENKHLPILVAKRSREIMVVKVLDVQYGRPSAIVRLQRTLGTQPRPQGLLYGVVSPPKIGCSYTVSFLQNSRWGNSFGLWLWVLIAFMFAVTERSVTKGKDKTWTRFDVKHRCKSIARAKTLDCRGPLNS